MRVRCFACKRSLEQRSARSDKTDPALKSCLEHLPSQICTGEVSGEDGSEGQGKRPQLWGFRLKYEADSFRRA